MYFNEKQNSKKTKLFVNFCALVWVCSATLCKSAHKFNLQLLAYTCVLFGQGFNIA